MPTLSPLGTFLEVTFASQHVLEDMAFFKDLGFQEIETGEIVNHAYGVVSDGSLCLGFHDQEFAPLSLTYVLPELATKLAPLRSHVGDFEYQNTQPDEFNELCMLDPAGLPLRVLEARTFSPPNFGGAENVSMCGRFGELALPTNNIDQRKVFYEGLGFVSGTTENYAMLMGDGLNLGFYSVTQLKKPALKFQSNDLESIVRHAALHGVVFSDVTENEHGLESVTLSFRPDCDMIVSLDSEDETEFSDGEIVVSED